MKGPTLSSGATRGSHRRHERPRSSLADKHSQRVRRVGQGRPSPKLRKPWTCVVRNIDARCRADGVADINRAYERVVNKDVRYRLVIDMASLKAVGTPHADLKG